MKGEDYQSGWRRGIEQGGSAAKPKALRAASFTINEELISTEIVLPYSRD